MVDEVKQSDGYVAQQFFAEDAIKYIAAEPEFDALLASIDAAKKQLDVREAMEEEELEAEEDVSGDAPTFRMTPARRANIYLDGIDRLMKLMQAMVHDNVGVLTDPLYIVPDYDSTTRYAKPPLEPFDYDKHVVNVDACFDADGNHITPGLYLKSAYAELDKELHQFEFQGEMYGTADMLRKNSFQRNLAMVTSYAERSELRQDQDGLELSGALKDIAKRFKEEPFRSIFPRPPGPSQTP